MRKVVVISATDEVNDLLTLTLPKIKAYASKCGAELIILTGLPKEYQHGKYRIFEVTKIKADRILLVDADILIRDNAIDIFEFYPDGNWMFNEGKFRGHGFEAHRKELEKYLSKAKLPLCIWPKLDWWNPGVALLSQEAVKNIFEMPPWNVNTCTYGVEGGKTVKNMPWINYRIAITNTKIDELDIRWNTFSSAPAIAQRDACFWHCFCKEITSDRTRSKVRVVRQMCNRFKEPLTSFPTHKYNVHFVCGKQSEKWILERMQEEIIKYAPQDVSISMSDVAHDDVNTINYFNPYRRYAKKSKHAKDVVFCTHPEVVATWNKSIVEADHIVCMCKQYANEAISKRDSDSVSLIYPGVDPEYYEHKLQILNPVKMSSHARKGILDWKILNKVPWLRCRCTDGKLTRAQLLLEYSACDAVVSTAVLEGGPMSILEAAALGKPCYARRGVGFGNDFAEVFPNLHLYTDIIELMNMLQEAYDSKEKSPWNLTWEKWAKKHWIMFDKVFNNPHHYPQHR